MSDAGVALAVAAVAVDCDLLLMYRFVAAAAPARASTVSSARGRKSPPASSAISSAVAWEIPGGAHTTKGTSEVWAPKIRASRSKPGLVDATAENKTHALVLWSGIRPDAGCQGNRTNNQPDNLEHTGRT
eukprot:6095797-Pyramimonas_sp.AAC.1